MGLTNSPSRRWGKETLSSLFGCNMYTHSWPFTGISPRLVSLKNLLMQIWVGWGVDVCRSHHLPSLPSALLLWWASRILKLTGILHMGKALLYIPKPCLIIRKERMSGSERKGYVHTYLWLQNTYQCPGFLLRSPRWVCSATALKKIPW